ncbi:MAG: hypothetical protein KDD37_07670 [Bdellovibrionales bacterium]|nr:hypothetical protein [Bdellovibrionales bacterium]
MKNKLYDFIYEGIKNKDLRDLNAEDFCEAVYLRYKEYLKTSGLFTPQKLYRDVRMEITDEILKVYRMKTYGCFNLKSYTDKKNNSNSKG